MPLVQIHLLKGKSPQYIQAVADGIHQALRTLWKVKIGRFQTIQEYPKGHFYIDKTFLGVKRSEHTILICITTTGCSSEMKKKLYRELVQILGKKPKVKKEDIWVNIIQIEREDWFLGRELTP